MAWCLLGTCNYQISRLLLSAKNVKTKFILSKKKSNFSKIIVNMNILSGGII